MIESLDLLRRQFATGSRRLAIGLLQNLAIGHFLEKAQPPAYDFDVAPNTY
jgi:hypothetical protein